MENSYTLEPSYNFHDYTEDVVNVLACQIKVWKATAPNWFDDPGQYTVITEVENIEILESYQELITGAIIHLPKGAIIEDTIITKERGKISSILLFHLKLAHYKLVGDFWLLSTNF